MRAFALLIFVISGLLGFSSALTPDTCEANAWVDPYDPNLTIDESLVATSRWSCHNELGDLEGEPCQIWYTFSQPVDIEVIRFALWQGNLYTRTIKVTFYDSDNDTTSATFPSSGTSDAFEDFYVFTTNTAKVVMEAVGLDDDDRLNILEVQFL